MIQGMLMSANGVGGNDKIQRLFCCEIFGEVPWRERAGNAFAKVT